MNTKAIGVMFLLWGSGLITSFYESLGGQQSIGIATIIASAVLAAIAGGACNDTK